MGGKRKGWCLPDLTQDSAMFVKHYPSMGDLFSERGYLKEIELVCAFYNHKFMNEANSSFSYGFLLTKKIQPSGDFVLRLFKCYHRTLIKTIPTKFEFSKGYKFPRFGDDQIPTQVIFTREQTDIIKFGIWMPSSATHSILSGGKEIVLFQGLTTLWFDRLRHNPVKIDFNTNIQFESFIQKRV